MTTDPTTTAAPCPHAVLVDVERLASVSDVASRGLSWLLRWAEDEPVWITRNSRVVAVIHPVGRDHAE